MSQVRHVCLSDLHLGAAYSLLTHSDDHGEPDPTVPSATLTAFGQALRQTVAALNAGAPGGTDAPLPTLVLLGDVLDLGLSPMGDACAGFERFIEALYPAGAPPVFSPHVLCVPGNHDHHLWRVAQDRQYLDALGGDRPPADLIEETPLFVDAGVGGTGVPAVPSELLTRLMRRQPHLADARVDIVYPNLGLFDAASGRCVLMHHGHYVDSTYTAMSALDAAMPHGEPPGTVAQIERQNGPWVDFLWSDLGSAGATGRGVMTLYEILRDAGASRRFTRQAGDLAVAQLGSTLGLSAQTQTVKGLTVEQVLRALLDATVGRGAESERDADLEVITADGLAQLRTYLGGPLLRQLEASRVTAAPAGPTGTPGITHMSFVYGHTHKPYQRELAVPGYAQPVAVLNTGGWVIDQPTMGGTQGAAAVLIDDTLNVASLRLFNDPVNGRVTPVHAADAASVRPRANPMLAALRAALDAQQAPWQQFSEAACAAAELQAQRLLDRFFTPDDA